MTGLPIPDVRVTVSALAALSYIYWSLRPKPIKGIPHNPIKSILGDIPEIRRFVAEKHCRAFDYFAFLTERHGPITQVFLGSKTFLILGDLKEAERILIQEKQVDSSPEMRALSIPVMPKSILALPANEMWKRHRRIMGPSMHRRYLSRMTHHIVDVADALVRLWDAKIDLAGNNSFSARSDLKLATMHAPATILTGSKVESLDLTLSSMRSPTFDKSGVANFHHLSQPTLVQAFTTLMAGAHLGRQIPFRSLAIPMVLWFYPGWTKSRNTVRSYLQDALESSIKREDVATTEGSLLTDADCVIDMVVQQERREGVEIFEREELLDELCLYVLAGQDTTSAALMWFVKYMPQNMEIQQLLHEEVCSQLPDPHAIPLEAAEDVDRMPVLEAVVTETLRCAKVASGVIRRTLADMVILGKHIPKGHRSTLYIAKYTKMATGTDIMVVSGPIAKSEVEWGPDAMAWRPQRWLRPDGSFNPDAGYGGHPFGMGHRSCFGQRLAVAQLKIFIVAMSRAFVFKSVAPAVDSWDSGAEITNMPKECYVSLERWEN
ncbi:cytochrome P450 family protein [Ceratobasidium sp. AG-Ba]|nr:cytochrome P450 family protein [Ceratobasidium sp. AG-Ba]